MQNLANCPDRNTQRIPANRLVGVAFLVAAVSWPLFTQRVGLAKEGVAPVKALEQKRIDDAIDRGIAYLRRTQLENGSWAVGKPNQQGIGISPQLWPVGYAALPALALLQGGVPAPDPALQRAARFVRANVPTMSKTYEISLAILFLDRLGERDDRALVRTLALRLAAGKTRYGSWAYHCPILSPEQEKKVVEALAKPKEREDLKGKQPKKKPGESFGDNSNTQFAIMGLWAARKYDLPLDSTFAGVEQRFRVSQTTAGWDYVFRRSTYGTGAMTCVGLLGLAVGRGSGAEPEKAGDEDQGISWGLRALSVHMKEPTDKRFAPTGLAYGPKGALNLYFLWSIERVGVLLNLKTIGGIEWYPWGVDLLLPTQRKDGSWVGRGSGGSPVIDTSMALLFLKRSDLLPDLRETLQKRLKITDPGLDKSPGEKDLKKRIEKKSPGEKNGPSVELRRHPLNELELIETKRRK